MIDEVVLRSYSAVCVWQHKPEAEHNDVELLSTVWVHNILELYREAKYFYLSCVMERTCHS